MIMYKLTYYHKAKNIKYQSKFENHKNPKIRSQINQLAYKYLEKKVGTFDCYEVKNGTIVRKNELSLTEEEAK